MRNKRITPPPGERLNLGATNAFKTAETMKRVILENRRTPAVLELAQRARNLARRYNLPIDLALGLAAFKAAYYEPDGVHQTIRTPARTMYDKAANCVDYTVLIAAAGTHFCTRVGFELAAYQGDNFTHVYPVLDGKPVDVVPDQNQTGKERVYRTLGKLPTFEAMRGTITPTATKFFDVWTCTY